MLKISTLLLLLITLTYSRTLDPRTDITNYEFRFTRLTTTQNLGPVGTLADTLHISWDMITATMPLSEQPDPTFLQPYDMEVVVTIPNSQISYGDSTTTYTISKSSLTTGQWQVQLRAAVDNNGTDLYSKYSDALPFVIVDPSDPPQPPISIFIDFK